ncbi:hypothetical protein EON73_04685 [bacterium]|nr:MAG: hypothetical protein EON73_04685 [bacterium]
MNENFIKLIDKLKNKTVSKQAIWSKTSSDHEFKLELQKGAITVDNWDENRTTYVDLNIINENGDIIDRIYFAYADEEYDMLLELHQMAKRSYFKVDEILKNIFYELDSNKVVGKEGKSEDDDLF